MVGKMNTAISPKAVLCCQCGQVSETAQNCPYCGSVAVLNLARILDRPESKAETVEVYDLIDEKWIAMLALSQAEGKRLQLRDSRESASGPSDKAN